MLKKTLLCGALFFALSSSLTGCVLTQHKVVDTLPVGTITLDDVATQITGLVSSQYLIDDNTISVMKINSHEAKELLLCEKVGNKLNQKGYAVQMVLPESERQAGDVSRVSPSGIKLEMHLLPLIQSSYYRLHVQLNGLNFYRLYLLNQYKLTPVSPWSSAKI